jgi:hypothetical protein
MSPSGAKLGQGDPRMMRFWPHLLRTEVAQSPDMLRHRFPSRAAQSLPSASVARLSFVFACSLAASAVMAVVACGGTVQSSDPNGTSGGTQKNGTGEGTGTVISQVCPSNAPVTGTPCFGAVACEYGGEGAFLECTTLSVCGADGWQTSPPDAKCHGVTTKNEAACPSSYAGLAAGAACPATLQGGCVYPEGLCECTPCGPPDGGPTTGKPAWSCAQWPNNPPSCPTPRPRAGSSCTMEGQQCDYENACSAVSLGLPNLVCTGGVWARQRPELPPCRFPLCAQ